MAGTTAPGFEAVAEVLAGIVAGRPGEPACSAQLCVVRDGETVVDLWGGPAFGPDSLTVVFSVTKGMATILVARLVQAGVLDPKAPVVEYWPEFAAAGKEAVTVEQLLSHQAGVIGVDGGFSLDDCIEHDKLAARLAVQVPYWRPGYAHGYHAVTFGVLVRELVERVTGESFADLFEREVRAPLDADAWMVLPESEEGRVVPLQWQHFVIEEGTSPFGGYVLPELTVAPDGREVRAAVLPALGGVATARGLARMYAACVGEIDGHRLLDDATLDDVTARRCRGYDLTDGRGSAFALGFHAPFPRLPYAGEGSFGHDGMGGAIAFASRRHRLGFGFTTDVVPPAGGVHPRHTELIDAVL